MSFDPNKAVKMHILAEDILEKTLKLREQIEKEVDSKDNTLGDSCEHFVLLRTIAELITKGSKEINKYADFVSYSVLPDKMTEQGAKTITTETGYRVTMNTRLSVTMSDKEAGYKWLEDNNLGALIKPTVNSSSLSAAIKEMIETENREPPDDIFSVKPAIYSSVTKVKK